MTEMWIVVLEDLDIEDCDKQSFGPWNSQEEAVAWATGRAEKCVKNILAENPEDESEIEVDSSDAPDVISVRFYSNRHDYSIRKVRSPDSAEDWV